MLRAILSTVTLSESRFIAPDVLATPDRFILFCSFILYIFKGVPGMPAGAFFPPPNPIVEIVS